MTKLIKNLGSFAIFDDNNLDLTQCDLSGLLASAIDMKKVKFTERSVNVDYDISENILINADNESMNRAIGEIIDNAVKYSLTKAHFSLLQEKGYTVITASNDTDLPDGNCEQIFDRFTTLENAKGKNGAGLGLSYVKDIVKAHNGRCRAKVENGIFTIYIYL